MKRRWRDANLMDLARPELRPLIDLRSKPNYHAPGYHDEELDLVNASVPPVAAASSPPLGEAHHVRHGRRHAELPHERLVAPPVSAELFDAHLAVTPDARAVDDPLVDQRTHAVDIQAEIEAGFCGGGMMW